MPRTRGSFQGGGRFGRRASAVSLAIGPAPRLCSADRRSVDQAALGPEIVVTAFELERRSQAEMLIEDLAVIADRLDRVVGPFLVQSAQRLPHAGCHAEQALNVWVVVLGHVIEVLLGNAL